MRIHREPPGATRAYRGGGWVALTACLIALGGCGNRSTPEQQVRAVIATGEAAAEKRDLSALMDLVSSRYEDSQGGSAVELTRRLRGYFIVNQSVHLLTRIESIEFPYQDLARVRLTLGTLGRQTTAADTIDLAADVHFVQLELHLERGEWKVTRAEWHPLGAT
jgi:hypothetical protein